MIKGRYVAQVTIDYAIKENMPGLLPFEKLKDVVQNQTTDAIKAMLEDEMSKIGRAHV